VDDALLQEKIAKEKQKEEEAVSAQIFIQ